MRHRVLLSNAISKKEQVHTDRYHQATMNSPDPPLNLLKNVQDAFVLYSSDALERIRMCCRTCVSLSWRIWSFALRPHIAFLRFLVLHLLTRDDDTGRRIYNFQQYHPLFQVATWALSRLLGNWREEKEFYFHLISFLSSSHLVVWEHEPTSTSSYISLTAIFPIEFNERGLYLNILFLWDFPKCRPFLLVGPCTEHPCTLSAHRMADRGSHNSKRIVSLEKWKEWIP